MVAGLRFEWDPEKARCNQRKHGVSFEEALTVFGDLLAADIPDQDHSKHEHRFVIMGLSEAHRILVVSYTERADAIRLISARIAEPAERKEYEEGT